VFINPAPTLLFQNYEASFLITPSQLNIDIDLHVMYSIQLVLGGQEMENRLCRECDGTHHFSLLASIASSRFLSRISLHS
jgi:hypothetical protein